MEVDNTGAPQYPEIKAIVGQAGTLDVYLAETKGKRFVAKTPEGLDYDEDGNLPALRSLGEGGTSDGRWTNRWDAENRLISMETLPSVVSAGIPRERLEFAYDSQCRRVRRTALSGFTNGTFSITNTTGYLNWSYGCNKCCDGTLTKPFQYTAVKGDNPNRPKSR